MRIISMSSHGPLLRLYLCQGDGVRLQILCSKQEATGPDAEQFVAHHKLFKRGDIIGVIGFPGRSTPRDSNSEQGFLGVFAREMILLTPCLRLVR
jgi:lysyl-tRNA synthetase class 2